MLELQSDHKSRVEERPDWQEGTVQCVSSSTLFFRAWTEFKLAVAFVTLVRGRRRRVRTRTKGAARTRLEGHSNAIPRRRRCPHLQLTLRTAFVEDMAKVISRRLHPTLAVTFTGIQILTCSRMLLLRLLHMDRTCILCIILQPTTAVHHLMATRLPITPRLPGCLIRPFLMIHLFLRQFPLVTTIIYHPSLRTPTASRPLL